MCDKNMKNRLIELLKSIPKRPHIVNGIHVGTKLHTAESVAEYLIENGVLVPPCKVGDTVYAALGPILGEEPCIEEWKVKGVAYNLKGEMLAQSFDGEWYVVGEEYCLLTREAAEQALECCATSDKMQQINLKGDKRNDNEQ